MLKKLLLCAFVAFFVCDSFAFAATPKDTIIIAVENQATQLNPLFMDDHDASIGLIFSGLTRFDENMKIQPDLAKSWKISNDGLTYSFELRSDVLWHDGERFSAEDVKFTLEAINNPRFNSLIRPNFEMIKEVKVLDSTHINITLKEPYAGFLDALNAGILPRHILQNEDLNTSKFNQKPIGTGAFKFQKWQKGQYLILEANENYYLGKVQSPKIILKTISDPNIAAIELKNASIDVALVGFESVEGFKNDKNFNLLVAKSADYRALMYNFNNLILREKAVREALNYAVDKDAIVKNLLHSLGKTAHQPLQNSWASPKNYAKTQYNPKKAISILSNAGWQKNARGVLEKDGVELTFDAYAMSNDPLRVALVKLLASEFAKIGVELKPFAKVAGSFDYTKVDSFLVGWGSPYDPDFHTYRVFESSQDEAWNFGHYKNANVDSALKKARSTSDLKQRKAHYAEFIKALQDDTPFLFLVYLDFPLVAHKNIKGIKLPILGHHGVGFTANAWQWRKE